MAPPEDTPDDFRDRIQTSLTGTPYDVSSLEPLNGGLSNFTYRAALLRDLEDGSTDVLVKHAEPYMAKFPANPITTDRCVSINITRCSEIKNANFLKDVEAACLKELSSVEVCSGTSSTAKFTVRAPRCYHYDFSTKTQVQEFLPGVVGLKAHCMSTIQTPAAENGQHDYHLLGKSLAEYILRAQALMTRTIEDQAGEVSDDRDTTALHGTVTKGSEIQKLVHTINYDWLFDRIEQFPEMLSDARDVFVQVKEHALGEIQGRSGNLSVINGDFGPHKYVFAFPRSYCVTG